ncbi:MAG: ABC transporter permease [Albidovulum sp.]
MALSPTPTSLLTMRLRILVALVIREMCARFGRSWGGYIWAIAEPTGGILLLSVAFSFIAHTPPIGTSFVFFYASGIVPFMMYTAIANSTMFAIRGNRGLLTYPIVTALDTLVARAILDALTHSMIALILFPLILTWEGINPNITPGALALAFLMVVSLGVGVGTLNCVIVGFFPTWQNIWSLLNRPLFVISGILFSFGSVPTRLRDVLAYNPLAQAVEQTRHGLYGSVTPGFVSIPYVFGISLAFFVIGAYLMRRNEGFLLQP